MLILSLIINVLVLVPVCVGLAMNARWASAAYGPQAPARGILLSVYLAVLILSAALLVIGDVSAVAALLACQVIYKFTTPFTVRDWRNPVVLSNLAIAAFHSVSLGAAYASEATVGPHV